MALCNHVGRAGLVTNIDPATWPEGTRGRSHCSVAVCRRESCKANAIRHVAGLTNSTAAFYPDPQRMSAATR